MDPDANLIAQLAIAARICIAADECAKDIRNGYLTHVDIDSDDAVRLAELVLQLDDWLQHGGFKPERWTK